jgi:hypothetical protein
MRFLATLLLLAAVPAHADVCALSPSDRAFVDRAVQTWEGVRRDSLGIADAKLPAFYLFDQKCLWRDRKETGTEHGGTLTLPGGMQMPARLMTFASSDDSGQPFLVMALPALWTAEERHRGNPQLDLLMRSVFVHEMTHTVQARALGGRLTELEKEHAIEDLNDDIIQQRFGTRDGYADAYQKERGALYGVATATDPIARRALAREALRIAKERRAKYFKGADSYYAEIEEIFLGMEGVAQWAAYQANIADGTKREDAFARMTKSGRFWTQDEGLIVFLAIDALMPGKWQPRVMGEKVTGVWTLLEEAAK